MQTQILNILRCQHFYLPHQLQSDSEAAAQQMIPQIYGLLLACWKTSPEGAQHCYMDDLSLREQLANPGASQVQIKQCFPIALYERSHFPDRKALLSMVLRYSKPKVKLAHSRVIQSPKIQKQNKDKPKIEEKKELVKPMAKIRDPPVQLKIQKRIVVEEERKKITPEHQNQMEVEDNRPTMDEDSGEEFYKPKVVKKKWDMDEQQIIQEKKETLSEVVQIKKEIKQLPPITKKDEVQPKSTKIEAEESDDEDLLLLMAQQRQTIQKSLEIKANQAQAVKSDRPPPPSPMKKQLSLPEGKKPAANQQKLDSFLAKKVK